MIIQCVEQSEVFYLFSADNENHGDEPTCHLGIMVHHGVYSTNFHCGAVNNIDQIRQCPEVLRSVLYIRIPGALRAEYHNVQVRLRKLMCN